MKRSILIAILLISIAAPSTYAGWYDGNELKKICSSSNEIDQGECLGFIAAATSSSESHHYCEIIRGGKKVLKWTPPGDCKDQQQLALPEKMKLGQAKAIVVKYLDDNPAELHRDAIHIVDAAMIGAFGFRKIAP